MGLYNELKQRGIIYQVSNEEAIKKLLEEKKISFYVGFDPTAESLHVGNLFQIVTMKRLERAGLKPIALVGGATGMIGDPSGKSEERQLSSAKDVNKRAELFKKQLARFFDFRKTALFANNFDWFKNFKVLEFLRDIGKHFQINVMLKKESVETRLETGISYTEFSYMLMQAYDFFKLNEKCGCQLEIGGSDQWGNITAGIDLIRRLKSKEVYGFTIPLVTTSDGKKMGKSEEGAIWLDSKMTSPYQFYQFWLNVDDKDVIKFLKYYTFLSLEEIEKLAVIIAKEPEKREAQKVLAKEMTEFVHGKTAYGKIQKISQALFYGNIKELKKDELEEAFSNIEVKEMQKFKEKNIVDFLAESGVSSSKRQAREDVERGAIEINGAKIKELFYSVDKKDLLFGEYIVAKRGKKDYHFVKIK